MKKEMKEDMKETWKMPDWMKPYEAFIVNTGGNDVEELVNDDGTNSNIFNDAARALFCASVKSQVALLIVLHEMQLLKQMR